MASHRGDSLPTGYTRSLTRAEEVTIATLIGESPLESDRERIRASGLPARTYEMARFRALRSGWIAERFVPDPRVAGYTHAVFVFGRPFAERHSECSNALRSLAGTVLQLESRESVFSISFVRSAQRNASHPARLLEGAFASLVVLEADLARPHVPAYFDFSASWSRACGSFQKSTYPNPIPHGVAETGIPSPAILRDAELLTAAPSRSSLAFGSTRRILGRTAVGLGRWLPTPRARLGCPVSTPPSSFSTNQRRSSRPDRARRVRRTTSRRGRRTRQGARQRGQLARCNLSAGIEPLLHFNHAAAPACLGCIGTLLTSSIHPSGALRRAGLRANSDQIWLNQRT